MGERILKIACIGNMNNMLFCLSRYLRDRGHDVELLLMEGEPSHFSPAMDSLTPELDREWIHPLPWGVCPERIPASSVRQALEPYDVLIGCGYAPAYAMRAGRTLDLFVPYGSDIYDLTQWRALMNLRGLLHPRIILRRMLQRRGVERCRHLLLDQTNAQNEQNVNRLNLPGVRHRFAPPMVYAPQYSTERWSAHGRSSELVSSIGRLKTRCRWVIFHHTRHIWRTHVDAFSHKGNDKLLRAIAAFNARHPEGMVGLATFQYGVDWEASRELSRELGIAEQVHWSPLMPRSEIIAGIQASDLVAGEFGLSWFTYGVVYEAMSVNRPLLGYRDMDLYPDEKGPYPMYSACTQLEIEEALERASADLHALREVGEKAGEWFRHRIDQTLDCVESIIAEGRAGGRV